MSVQADDGLDVILSPALDVSSKQADPECFSDRPGSRRVSYYSLKHLMSEALDVSRVNLRFLLPSQAFALNDLRLVLLPISPPHKR